MQVSLETTNGLERKLTVGIPASVVDAEVEKRLKDAAKSVRINGFRKGKVPMKVVKQHYGKGVRQEVLGDTIQRSFFEAVQKESIRPAGQPSIEPKQLDEGKDIEFIATFEVYPDLTVTGFENLEIIKYQADISESDVDKMIETLRKSQAEWNQVERAAQIDDRVNIDYKGTKDGEEFAGGSAQDQKLVLGSGSMIAGFEDGIVDMKPGEVKTISVTFPDDYKEESLRSAKANFEITLNSLEAQVLPEIDEAFFAKYGVSEGGEEEFRKEVKSNMEREKERGIRNRTKEQVLNGLLDNNKFDIPQSLITSEIDILRNQTLQQFGGMNKDLDYRSILPDEMFKARAEKRVALGLIIAEIVTKENIKADKEVVKKIVEEAASTYEDPQEVINYYYTNRELMAGVEASALEEQVVEFILAKSKVSEETVSYEVVVKPLDQL